MTKPGWLITFEGIDGCGKSTQIALLREYLEKKGVHFSVFREPGGTSLSEQIRTILLHEKGAMNPVTELLLFSAARSQLIREKDRKSTRLNSSHVAISYAVFCLKKKNKTKRTIRRRIIT